MKYLLSLLMLTLLAACAAPESIIPPDSTAAEEARLDLVVEKLDQIPDEHNFSFHLIDDHAVYFRRLILTVSKIEIQGPPQKKWSKLGTMQDRTIDEPDTKNSAWTTLVDGSQTFDLLELQGKKSRLMTSAALTPGAYTQVRLTVDRATAELKDGSGTISLKIAGNGRIKHQFQPTLVIKPSSRHSVIIDLPAEESLSGKCRTADKEKGNAKAATVGTLDSSEEHDTEEKDIKKDSVGANSCKLSPVLKEARRVKSALTKKEEKKIEGEVDEAIEDTI